MCDQHPLPENVKVCAPQTVKLVCFERLDLKNEGPVGRITRNQEFDLIGGKFVYRCGCGARNGLEPECRRISCQGNNPGCKMNPPKCWPKYRPPPVQFREIECPSKLICSCQRCHQQVPFVEKESSQCE